MFKHDYVKKYKKKTTNYNAYSNPTIHFRWINPLKLFSRYFSHKKDTVIQVGNLFSSYH